MSNFVNLVGMDGNHRAMHVDDIRLLVDDDVSEGLDPRTTVTLVDGTQFGVKGDVTSILKTIESQETW